jgi:hypothetical protein
MVHNWSHVVAWMWLRMNKAEPVVIMIGEEDTRAMALPCLPSTLLSSPVEKICRTITGITRMNYG